MKKIVITGATGFIGKDLLKRIDRSAYDCTLVSRNPDKLKGIPDEFQCVKADLQDKNTLIQAFRGQDAVINLAAEVRNQNQLEATNVQGTENLIEAMRETGIKRLIHLSSVGVVGAGYARTSKLVTEKSALEPQNRYEQTKCVSEKLLLENSTSDGFDVVILRPTNVFGEQHPYHALLRMLRRLSEGKRLPYSKHAVANFVYVGDVSAAIMHFLSSESHDGVFNVGRAVKMEQFIDLLATGLDTKSRKMKIPEFAVSLLDRLGIHTLHSVSNAVEFSDAFLSKEFEYPFGLEEGIRNTVDFYRSKGLL